MIDKQLHELLNLLDHPAPILLVAGVCLALAIRLTARAVRPLLPIIQSAAAAAVAVFAAGVALLLLVAVTVTR